MKFENDSDVGKQKRYKKFQELKQESIYNIWPAVPCIWIEKFHKKNAILNIILFAGLNFPTK